LAAANYAIRGPGYVLDDWYALANAHFDGWWHAAGHDQWLARPGAGVAYAVMFGIIGRHPLAAYALLVVLNAVAAVLVWRLLRRFMDDFGAIFIAGVWVIVPDHGSLLYWPSAVNITLALVLLLAGLLVLADDRVLPAALVLAASVLCYEATAPAAVLGLAVVPWLLGRSARKPLLMGAAVLAPVAVWMIAFWHPSKRGLEVNPDFGQLLPAHLGWGVMPRGPVAVGMGVVACVATTLLFVDAARRRRAAAPEAWLAIAGVATIIVGTAPFVHYFYGPLGFGDRVNVVAGVGTAMLWAALAIAAWRVLPRAAAIALVGVAGAAMGVAGNQASTAWSDAGADAVSTLSRLESVAPGTDVAVPAPPLRRNVAAFLDRSNVQSAVQLELDDRTLAAHLARADGVRPES
jgi:hypothetical protein